MTAPRPAFVRAMAQRDVAEVAAAIGVPAFIMQDFITGRRVTTLRQRAQLAIILDSDPDVLFAFADELDQALPVDRFVTDAPTLRAIDAA